VEVATWLRHLGLEQYAKAFVENALDEHVLADLTETDLQKLGVLLGHRKKLLKAIAKLGRPGETTRLTLETLRDSAERRQVTVLFSDLVGSTALAARLDPEDLREVIGVYYRCVAAVVARFGGYVAKHMGDGIVAYFGFPTAHEYDAERAVRAGLAIIDAVREEDAAKRHALNVRIGIATGVVVAGEFSGSGRTEEHEIVGETPNLAARLQEAAAPGTLVISPSTRHLCGELFEYSRLGAVTLKGFAEPLSPFQVLGAGVVESRSEAQHTTNQTPLVGREREVNLLQRRWQQVQGGGRVVLLLGEPGIGKSRITRAFVDRLAGQHHLHWRYFCSPHHQHSALFPILTGVARAAGITRGDTPEQRLRKLETVVFRPGTPPETIAPIATLLSLPVDPRYQAQDLTPQQRKERTLDAFMMNLAAQAADQPVLLIFEDVHWIDPTSSELLTVIVERAAGLRILVIITARPEFTQAWSRHEHVTSLSLARLSRGEAAALVGQVTGGKNLPFEVMEQILERTDGIPLFIEELTKAVIETGAVIDAGRQFTTRSVAPVRIPTTLQDSLTARLDRHPQVKEVAQIASCIGRDFEYPLLARISELSDDLLRPAVVELQQAGLLNAGGDCAADHYSFKHALVRDAAYAGLLKARRIQLHAAIARVVEQSFPDLVDSQPELVAYHAAEAGLIEKAADYWLRAGKACAARSANLEAIAHLRRGIEAVASLSSPRKDHLEFDLQFTLGPCLIATQGAMSEMALATFARARELCDRLGDPPEYFHVFHWLMTARALRGELAAAQEDKIRALAVAEKHGDRPSRINFVRGLGMISLIMGQLIEARQLTEKALDEFASCDEGDRLRTRAAGQDAGVASAAVLAWTLWLLGHVDIAGARMAAAIERAVAIKHPHSEAYARYYASILHSLRGEPAIAREHSERCLALSDEYGFRHWRGLSLAVRDTCGVLLDAPCGEPASIEGGLDDYLGAGYRLGVTAIYVLMCRAFLRKSSIEAADDVIRRGLAIAEGNGERMFEAELYRLKARVALIAPDRHGAAPQSLLELSLSIARQQGARSLELSAAQDLAGLLRDRGKRAEAEEVLARSTIGQPTV
jgi:class 3 adenylate cyclase/tetratricopeptide (TPR) repeat protein